MILLIDLYRLVQMLQMLGALFDKGEYKKDIIIKGTERGRLINE